jgi:hypothetical protein
MMTKRLGQQSKRLRVHWVACLRCVSFSQGHYLNAYRRQVAQRSQAHLGPP